MHEESFTDIAYTCNVAKKTTDIPLHKLHYVKSSNISHDIKNKDMLNNNINLCENIQNITLINSIDTISNNHQLPKDNYEKHSLTSITKNKIISKDKFINNSSTKLIKNNSVPKEYGTNYKSPISNSKIKSLSHNRLNKSLIKDNSNTNSGHNTR